jgi:ankyrin repeat protein/tetratricopeptide (TPR) repeat protein
VKFLVEKGAKVNSTTRTLSTPLRAACYDGHFNIVRFLVEHGADLNFTNRHGHTCLMIACYKGHIKIVRFLIENGADVNKKSIRAGYTAMHDCADAGHANIMVELIEHGAKMTKDAWNITPLFAAAMSGREHIYKLIVSHDAQLELQGDKTLCSDVDKITALEILGATFVDKMSDLSKAIKFWRKAIEIRRTTIARMEANGRGYEDIEPFEKVIAKPIEAYGHAVEFNSIEELDQIKNNPDALRMQALIIRERALGPTHPETLYYIRYRGALYADMGDLDSCFRLWIYALELQQKHLDPLSPETESSLISFAELLSFMIYESIHINLFDKMFKVLQKALAELKAALERYSNPSAISINLQRNCCQDFGSGNFDDIEGFFEEDERGEPDPEDEEEERPVDPVAAADAAANDDDDEEGDDDDEDEAEDEEEEEDQPRAICLRNTIGRRTEFVSFDRILIIIIYFIGCLCRFRYKLTEKQNKDLELVVYQLVKLNLFGRNKRTPLHIACNGDITAQLVKSTLCEIPIVEVVRILIDSGANVNALDINRNTPLHIACQHGSSTKNSIVKLLIERGAHLDLRNVDNEVPLYFITEWNRREKCNDFRPLQHFTLKCLCARAMNQNAIVYEGTIPQSLHDFVSAH